MQFSLYSFINAVLQEELDLYHLYTKYLGITSAYGLTHFINEKFKQCVHSHKSRKQKKLDRISASNELRLLLNMFFFPPSKWAKVKMKADKLVRP